MSVAGAARGLIITWGLVAFTLLQRGIAGSAPSTLDSFGPGPKTLLFIGLGLQVGRWLVLRAVARYEEDRGIEGSLSPTVRHTVDLLVDGVTVLLFAIATFQGLAGVAGSV